MNKPTKITLYVALPSLFVAGVVVAAILITNKKDTTNAASVLSATTTAGTNDSISLNPNSGATDIPLGGSRSASSAPDPNALKVNDGQSSGLGQSQIGGNQGQSQQSQSSSSAGAKVPGPETFAQYDQYKDSAHSLMGDITVGNGPELKSGMKASVLYKGWLTTGQLFDQSRPDSSGQLQPFTVTLGAHQVITGWEEGLLGMKVGGSRRIIVPPAVGYGNNPPQGSGIPAGAVLVFDVQLLDAIDGQ